MRLKDKMEYKIIFIYIFLGILIGIVLGIFINIYIDDIMLGDYDLYNCIYNNADSNGFNQNPIMIKKIQDECICFRENNYTNVLNNC